MIGLSSFKTRLLKEGAWSSFGRMMAAMGTAIGVRLVTESVPPKYRTKKIHPATRTFQALRIAVNRELTNLERFLALVPARLKKSGRVCIISFHSLEDRIVKHFFKNAEKKNTLKILTKKPKTPAPGEIDANPRARSAKLRAAEKI